jgi:hypothetical protein
MDRNIAVEYPQDNFEPGDRLALVLLNMQTGRAPAHRHGRQDRRTPGMASPYERESLRGECYVESHRRTFVLLTPVPSPSQTPLDTQRRAMPGCSQSGTSGVSAEQADVRHGL